MTGIFRIITNERLIAVNQDSLGIQGQCVKVLKANVHVKFPSNNGSNVQDCCSHGSIGGLTSPYSCGYFSHSWQVWAGPLAGDGWAVVILNRFDKEESITMDWHVDGSIPLGKYAVQVDNQMSHNQLILIVNTSQDLWSGEMLPDIVVGGEEWEGARWYGIVAAHDNRSYKLTPVVGHEER